METCVDTATTSSSAEPATCAPTPPKKLKTSQTSLFDHVSKTSTSTRENLNVKVAKFFYGCNIPFNVAGNELFLNLVSSLRPGYTPPTAKMLSGPLLDKVSNGLEDELARKLDGKNATLVEDGWSNIHNEPVTATSLHVDNKSYFVEAVNTGTITKSGENCKNLTQATIKSVEEKYNCKVRSIVTDNAKNMESMRNKLHEDDPDLLVYGCSSHWLNLLGNDLTPSSVIAHVVAVQKYFRNHHKPAAWLTERTGSLKPQLPGDTRWKSQLTCIDTFLTNKPHYSAIIMEHDEDPDFSFDPNIVSKIQDINLHKQCKDLASQLRPVANAIDRTQSDTCSLADACAVWLTLLEEPSLQSREHKKIVVSRFNKAIKQCHLAAYKLHPKYRGEKLTAEQHEQAMEWIMDKDESFCSAVINFQARSAPYPKSHFSASAMDMKPSTWWKSLRAVNANLPEGFIELATQLHDSPASSASIERIFSSFGYIHSKIRNRLGVDKTAKLVFCYRLLRGNKDIDWV